MVQALRRLPRKFAIAGCQRQRGGQAASHFQRELGRDSTP